jgi:epoxyqueuosine reductase
MLNHPEHNSRLIKESAAKLGFEFCGIARAEFLEQEAKRFESWLKKGYHGEMSYMENHFDKRLDPSLLVPGARSIISLMYNYYPTKHQREDSYKISKYAYGEDYHKVIKHRLKELVEVLREQIGDFHARVFTDSAPVMERSWAERSGLGWIGKHSLLINKRKGSYYFLAEIICDLELEHDPPVSTDHCGTCTRCLEACPTEAIIPDKTVDASKCISYFTIELKNDIPAEFTGKFDDWIFGCDICQDVCPWNRFSLPHSESRFEPRRELLEYSKQEWEEITEDLFRDIFKNSPLKRTKFSGLKRNLSFLKK